MRRMLVIALAAASVSGCSMIRGYESPYDTPSAAVPLEASGPADSEIDALRREVASLERRLALLEGGEDPEAAALQAPFDRVPRLPPPERARPDEPTRFSPDGEGDASRAASAEFPPATRERAEAATPASIAPAPKMDPIPARSVLRAAHLASYSSVQSARDGWDVLTSRFPDALASLTPRIERADLGPRGVFYRLKAGPFGDDDAVRAACAPLEDAGVYCAPSHYRGEPL